MTHHVNINVNEVTHLLKLDYLDSKFILFFNILFLFNYS